MGFKSAKSRNIQLEHKNFHTQQYDVQKATEHRFIPLRDNKVRTLMKEQEKLSLENHQSKAS